MDEALELEDIDAAYCLLFLREVRDAAFATVDEEGLPAVRVIDVMMVEDGRLYFVAARGKAFCADIMRTRYVAIVGQSQDFRTCRLRGAVERPDDEAERHRLIDRIFELNPSMRELYPGDSTTCWNRSTCRMRKASTSISAASPSCACRSPWDRCAQPSKGSSSRTAARNAALAPTRVPKPASRRGRRMPSSRSIACAAGCAGRRAPSVRSTAVRDGARRADTLVLVAKECPVWTQHASHANLAVRIRVVGTAGFSAIWAYGGDHAIPQAEARSEFVMGCDLRTNAEAALVGTGARLRPATGSG